MAKNTPIPIDDDFYKALNPWVFRAAYEEAAPGWVSQEKNDLKTYFDLWYIVQGSGSVKTDGQWVSYSQGDLVTIKPGEVYQQEKTAPDDPFHVFYFFVHPFGKINEDMDSRLSRYWPRIISLKYYPMIKDYFAELFETYTTKPQDYPLVLKATSLHIFRIFLSLLKTRKSTTLPPAFPRVLAARTYIETNYAKKTTLEKIAESSDLSASYLSALFHRHFHTSPIDYLIEVRLRAAKLLLAKGTCVSQTARITGFQSLHYFSRIFKKRLGISPTQFILSCYTHRTIPKGQS
jgi:AraC family transcriptional regulator, transcriptional activator for feuABC-ybbA operon